MRKPPIGLQISNRIADANAGPGRSKLRKSRLEQARALSEVDKYLAQKDRDFVAHEPQVQQTGARWKRPQVRVKDARCPPNDAFPGRPRQRLPIHWSRW